MIRDSSLAQNDNHETTRREHRCQPYQASIGVALADAAGGSGCSFNYIWNSLADFQKRAAA